MAFEVVRTGDEDDDDDDCEEEEGEEEEEEEEECFSFDPVPAVGGTKVLALVEVDEVLLLLFLIVLLVVVVVAMVVGALPSFLALKSGSKFSTSLTNAIMAASLVKPLHAFHASHFHFFFISVVGGDVVLQSPSVTCLERPYMRHLWGSVALSTTPPCKRLVAALNLEELSAVPCDIV